MNTPAERATEPATVASLLRRTLDAHGMSQAELATATGLSTKHVNQILQGVIDLSPRCAHLIGHELGIPAEVWITLQAVHAVRDIVLEQPPRGEPVTPKLRRQRDEARAERDALEAKLTAALRVVATAGRITEEADRLREAWQQAWAERNEARHIARHFVQFVYRDDFAKRFYDAALPDWLTPEPVGDAQERPHTGHHGPQTAPASTGASAAPEGPQEPPQDDGSR